MQNLRFDFHPSTSTTSSHKHSHTQAEREHGHTHDMLTHPGHFHARPLPQKRSYIQRAYTVGIGGPVGSGKTALVAALTKKLYPEHPLCIVTNDIFTREDAEYISSLEIIPETHVWAVETGGCPYILYSRVCDGRHAAIREDISVNLTALETLHARHAPELLLIESGGDNLAANYSRELADYIIYVIDVSGGDKIPRKGGPGITQSDLLVINKTDLAVHVGADLGVMRRDANIMRGEGKTIFTQVKHDVGVDEIVQQILEAKRIALQE